MSTPFAFSRLIGSLTLLLASLTWISPAAAEDKKPESANTPITQGQKVFTCGHSFHYFMPPILAEMAKAADIKGHEQVGQSSIGGSRIIQHWNVPDDKNKAKELLVLPAFLWANLGLKRLAEGERADAGYRIVPADLGT